MTYEHRKELYRWLVLLPILVWWCALAFDQTWKAVGLLEWADKNQFKNSPGTIIFGLVTAFVWLGCVRIFTIFFVHWLTYCPKCKCNH